MNILMCASESNPFYKTGGLGDVIYSLSKEFAKLGHNVSIAVPYYTHIGKIDKIDAKPYCNVNVHMNWRNINCEIYMQSVDGINYFFIKNDYYFGRNYYYGSYDDGERFAFFSLACLELIAKFPFFVDIVHVHDWQPGMIPCLLKTTYKDKPQYKNIKSVITIHNPEFKGFFEGSSLFDLYNLDYKYYSNGDVRFENKVSTLKAGIHFADKITTVSPTHAYELTTPEGSKGLWVELGSRKNDFIGILNGMDYGEFNPEKDKLIYKNYNAETFKVGKKACKEKFCKDHGLNPKLPLFAVVSRLSNQKGLDLMFAMADFIAYEGGNFAVLGSGEKYAEDYFNNLITHNSKHVYVYIGYNDPIAHTLYSASDFFIMPSAFEPCGLGQMIAQRYGSLPIVRRTGGLKDTVVCYDLEMNNSDKANGFGFDSYNICESLKCVTRCFNVYNSLKVDMNKMIVNAMKLDNTWSKSANKYLELYNQIVPVSK